MATIRAFFEKLGQFFPNFCKKPEIPTPSPPSSYALEEIMVVNSFTKKETFKGEE